MSERICSGKMTRRQQKKHKKAISVNGHAPEKEQISAICRKVNGYGPEKVARLDNLFVLNGYSPEHVPNT